MGTINAAGLGVRHAVSRALATANLKPADATFRIYSARLDVTRAGQVSQASVTVSVHRPRPVGDWAPEKLVGMVNPDGEHPLMVRIPAERPFFLDLFPVSWERWLRRVEDTLPPGTELRCPRVGVSLERARSFAAGLGKRLPTSSEFRMAWGDGRYPWGDKAAPLLGRLGEPRFDELPEVGFYPPNRSGLFDLGCWLWQWTRDGRLSGGMTDRGPGLGLEPDEDRLRPIGFRLAQDG